jgi:hypothetical protein
VITAERDEALSVGNQFIHAGFDLIDCLLNVERSDGEVSGVDNLGESKRARILGRVIRPQQTR